MKNIILLLFMCLCLTSYANINKNSKTTMTKLKDSVLRHVVIFKFKADATKQQITAIEEAFSALPSKIAQIMDYEWGLNNSPEGLSKGFTHCFFVTFKNEEDRAIYLPHPDHKAFVSLLTPVLEDVFVLDYWSN
ncbi:Dabb family protein [Cellulophaga omnivescoria]|uniref:Dabb family protein n=1 Tax=Cellulophaga omnivescoria TaxID=1888890 RepID=UPI0009867782|nr:Dabb family protein [Cellulophaga omnivescoria]WBU89534.1 Dabb family protein [Cellulophaga omnivescoria]WKB81557.1 Dabb family protein [Cellulophaga lytica]